MTAARYLVFMLAAAFILQAAMGAHVDQAGGAAAAKRGVTRESFGKTTNGIPVEIYTLTNANGV